MTKTFITTFSALLIFVGCGGGSTSNTPSQTFSTAKLDAQSSGITYECGSKTGTLGDDGTFTFEEGKPCTFKDGDVVIQTIPANQLQADKTYQEVTADLRTLIKDKTFYAVKESDSSEESIVELSFSDLDGTLKATVKYLGYQIPVPVTIDGNNISIDASYNNKKYNLDADFVSDKGDYLLFDDTNNQHYRLYKEKTKAEKFVTDTSSGGSTSSSGGATSSSGGSTSSSGGATSSSGGATSSSGGSTSSSGGSTSSSENPVLENLLVNHTYYSVKKGDSAIYKLVFGQKNLDGTISVALYSSSDTKLGDTSIKVTKSGFDIPAFSRTYNFISNEGDYLLFDGDRRMYISKDKAQAFVNAN